MEALQHISRDCEWQDGGPIADRIREPAMRSIGACAAAREALLVRPAACTDEPSIWTIFQPLIRAGASFPLPRGLSRKEAMNLWLAPDRHVLVAEESSRIVGSYSIRPRGAGGGRHVATCDYIVGASAAVRGIGADLIEHSILEARRRGYTALQRDFLSAADGETLRAFASLGFAVVGRVPRGFNHPVHGLVDVLALHRFL